jgi:hypothetical protein
MMCEFSRQLPGPAMETIARARRPITESGGSLDGDDRRGSITIPTPVGEIAGEYLVTGSTIAFRITQKPFFVPCAAIEARVDRFLFG